MGIFNMVGGGGGGGYKSFTQLKAMTLANAITELNTDPQGYYDNLNGNGHIIGIGIANDDKTSYQCWDVSPIIYWNGSWRNGEIIIAKIKTDSNGDLKIPVAGYTTSGSSQNASYNWWVSYNGGSETQYSGTGSASAITIASGLTADTEHTVVIRPNSESYKWARAFGYYNSGVQTYLTEIVYDGSYKGYGNSSINAELNFRRGQYRDCTNLTNTAIEVLPSTVTTIGNYFRGYQYRGCTSLTTTAKEILHNTVTTIGTYFRANQYFGCTSITTPADEVISSSITSIGNYFRSGQYNGCTALKSTTPEVMPNTVTSIGTYFRDGQYNGCTSIKAPAQEVISSIVTSIGDRFRYMQYQGCTSLLSATPEVMPNTVAGSVGNYFRANQYNGCINLIEPSPEVISSAITSIGTYFRHQQYNGCTSIKSSAQEVLPSSVTTIGERFRTSQYYGCTSLTTASKEDLPDTVTSIGQNFRSDQYRNCTSLTNIQGWKDLSIGGTNYRSSMYNGASANKTVKVIGDVGYASYNSSTLSSTYVSVVLVPSAYLQNYIDATTLPRSSITDSKFVGY